MIYVFKTSVKLKKEVRKLTPYLNNLARPSKWSFDLEDCDKILRVDSKKEVSETIIKIFEKHGFMCIELAE